MIQILLIGCNGHMGRAITQSCRYNENMTIVAGVDAVVNVDNDYPVYADIFDVKETVDIIIDFSHPKVLNVISKYALEKSLPLVIATTGHSDEQKDMIERQQAQYQFFFRQICH